MLISIGFGDFLDRLTILEIKSERIQNVEKKRTAQEQLASYKCEFQRAIQQFDQDCIRDLAELKSKLKEINWHLWDVEDALRLKDATECFDDDFVRQARRVYFLNDRRAEVKTSIDHACGSAVSEVKEHATAP
ncbi:hypothetical protein RC74_12505 [Falsihalocynthiibacter arcticus]|uniref:Uncharacterized protein n=1 Tax=Falsihalocynthiibacter arcticus TaxID=1579316 RepID=A0A126V0W6_9RHOB|nr:hypothetical protein RC74_12505 [Falsihalocynthiibacter arcticus]